MTENTAKSGQCDDVERLAGIGQEQVDSLLSAYGLKPGMVGLVNDEQ